MNLSKKILTLVLTMLIIISPCIISIAEAAHPSPWYHMKMQSYTTSKKFKKATKAVLATAVTTFLLPGGGQVYSLSRLANITAGALLTNYFVNSDDADVYFSIDYYYRELSDGRMDANLGIHIGDYEIKRVITSYSDSAKTNVISSEEHVVKSSIVDAVPFP